jgi:hypothetical protein
VWCSSSLPLIPAKAGTQAFYLQQEPNRKTPGFPLPRE